jgi:DNA-binding transcriptional ArsR family regulator
MLTEHLPSTAAVHFVGDPGQARVIMDPVRHRLLRALQEENSSAAGLARKLGEARQRVNYHLRELERAGFVELVEEKRKGNCTERVLRVTARQYLIDPNVLGAPAPGPEDVQDRFSADYLMALASRVVGEVATLKTKAASERKRLATLGMQAKFRLRAPADFAAFERDLRRALERVVAKHHDERSAGSRSFALILGVYPAKAG